MPQPRSNPFPLPKSRASCPTNSFKLTDILHSVCPSDAVIAFEFAGALHVHIDVRSLEDMTRLETLMPSLAGGVFYDIQRGLAARRSFFHRLSASVAR